MVVIVGRPPTSSCFRAVFRSTFKDARYDVVHVLKYNMYDIMISFMFIVWDIYIYLILRIFVSSGFGGSNIERCCTREGGQITRRNNYRKNKYEVR